MTQFKPLPPLAELHAAFSYDPETGVVSHKVNKRGRGRKAGEPAGTNTRGYIQVGHNNEVFMAHRIAWALHHGEDPFPYDIDHEDLNKSNNKITNLRKATRLQNCYNWEVKGWYKRGNRYQARIKIDGKLKCLGTFDTPEEASKASNDARKRASGLDVD